MAGGEKNYTVISKLVISIVFTLYLDTIQCNLVYKDRRESMAFHANELEAEMELLCFCNSTHMSLFSYFAHFTREKFS